jgi:hypothetical protein
MTDSAFLTEVESLKARASIRQPQLEYGMSSKATEEEVPKTKWDRQIAKNPTVEALGKRGYIYIAAKQYHLALEDFEA